MSEVKVPHYRISNNELLKRKRYYILWLQTPRSNVSLWRILSNIYSTSAAWVLEAPPSATRSQRKHTGPRLQNSLLISDNAICGWRSEAQQCLCLWDELSLLHFSTDGALAEQVPLPQLELIDFFSFLLLLQGILNFLMHEDLASRTDSSCLRRCIFCSLPGPEVFSSQSQDADSISAWVQ